MTNRSGLRIAALSGFLAVALGAFGAHGMASVLERHDTLAIWETAVFYHLTHTLVLLWLAGRMPFRRGPYWCLLAGILVFSGSLYLLAGLNLRWLGAVTPLGGVSLLAGWAWLFFAPGSSGNPQGSDSNRQP
jgi:uncharacterized membrane protein YgdD (TMEM256/DUF423 family)